MIQFTMTPTGYAGPLTANSLAAAMNIVESWLAANTAVTVRPTFEITISGGTQIPATELPVVARVVPMPATVRITAPPGERRAIRGFANPSWLDLEGDGVTFELVRLDVTVVPILEGGSTLVRGVTAHPRTAIHIDSCSFSTTEPSLAGVTTIAGAGPWDGALIRLSNVLIQGFADGVRGTETLELTVEDSAFVVGRGVRALQCRQITCDNSAFIASTGLEMEWTDPPGSVDVSVTDCRFEAAAGLRVSLAGRSTFTHRIAVLRCQFVSNGVGSEGVELSFQPGRVLGPLGGPSDSLLVVSDSLFVGLDVGIRVAATDSGRTWIDHCTFDLGSGPGLAVEGNWSDWLPGPTVAPAPGLPSRFALPPRLLVTNGVFTANRAEDGSPWPEPIVLTGGWPLLPSNQPSPTPLEPGPFVGGYPVLFARNLVSLAGFPIGRFAVSSPGSALERDAFALAQVHPGTVWENRVGDAILARPVSDGFPLNASDYHPIASLGSEAVSVGALPRLVTVRTGGAGGLGTYLAIDVLAAWGYGPRTEEGYYGNHRPMARSGRSPALGAAEPPGHADFPIMLYGVGDADSIAPGEPRLPSDYAAEDDPPISALADGFVTIDAMAAPPWGAPLEVQASVMTSLPVNLDIFRRAADSDLRCFWSFPHILHGGLAPRVSDAGPTQGVLFGLPVSKDTIGPAFTDWYLNRAVSVITTVLGDARARRAVAGWFGTEDIRPNVNGIWREYYFTARLAQLLRQLDPRRRGVRGYAGTLIGVLHLHATVTLAKALAPTLPMVPPSGPNPVPNWNPNWTPPSPAIQDETDFAVSLLEAAGVAEPAGVERRRIWDDRGFPAVLPAGSAPPTDLEGRTSVEYVPDRPPVTSPPARMDVDPMQALWVPVGNAPPFSGTVGGDTIYRPWASMAGYEPSLYPLRDRLGFIGRLQRDLFTQNYIDRVLREIAPLSNNVQRPNASAPSADQNRIWGFHNIRRILEAKTTSRQVLSQDSQALGPCVAYHAPELMNGPDENGVFTESTVWPTTPAHARHDFWVGLHEGEGVWLYNYGRRHRLGTAPLGWTHPGWPAYRECLEVLKAEAREFLVSGGPSTAAVSVGLPAAIRRTEEADYGGSLGFVPDYAKVNVTLRRLRRWTLAITTMSTDEAVSVDIDLGRSVVVWNSLSSGPAVTANPEGVTISFQGIDAAVVLMKET